MQFREPERFKIKWVQFQEEFYLPSFFRPSSIKWRYDLMDGLASCVFIKVFADEIHDTAAIAVHVFNKVRSFNWAVWATVCPKKYTYSVLLRFLVCFYDSVLVSLKHIFEPHVCPTTEIFLFIAYVQYVCKSTKGSTILDCLPCLLRITFYKLMLHFRNALTKGRSYRLGNPSAWKSSLQIALISWVKARQWC